MLQITTDANKEFYTCETKISNDLLANDLIGEKLYIYFGGGPNRNFRDGANSINYLNLLGHIG